MNDDGTASVQVVTGEADELRVLVNGTEEANTSNPSPGDTLSVSANPDSSITVVSEANGQSTVVVSEGTQPSGGPTAPTEGLIAHYTLDTGASDSVGSKDGSVVGATHLPDGGIQSDGAYSFDNNGDYINFPSMEFSSSDAPMTVSMWVRFNSPANGDYDTALWLRDSTDVIIRNQGNGDIKVYNNNFAANEPINANQWYHVVLTRTSGSEATAYLNATGIGTGSPGQDSFGQQNRLGRTYNDNQDYDGIIDDVRIYDRALSQSEVSDLYNATK